MNTGIQIDITQITLDEEAGRALRSTSNQSSTPFKWHSANNTGMNASRPSSRYLLPLALSLSLCHTLPHMHSHIKRPSLSLHFLSLSFSLLSFSLTHHANSPALSSEIVSSGQFDVSRRDHTTWESFIGLFSWWVYPLDLQKRPIKETYKRLYNCVKLWDSEIVSSGQFDVSLRDHKTWESFIGLFYRSLLQV